MTWTKVTPPTPHACEKPYYVQDGLKTGDIIRCDECKQYWLYTGVDYGVQWDPYPQGVIRWKKI